MLSGVLANLRYGSVGGINEVFDAEEPHEPGGCIAQAWSVAEPCGRGS
jgi:glycogen debranching enzyme